MGDSYEDLKSNTNERYNRLFRYTIMTVFIVLICSLISQNIGESGSKIVSFLSQFFGQINPLLLQTIVYLLFSNALTYIVRKESSNDIETFKAIQKGLDMEAKSIGSTFFQDFLSRFEGTGQYFAWACRMFPLSVFGIRFLIVISQFLDQTFGVPVLVRAIIVGFGFSAWVLWLWRIRIIPLKLLVRKKGELFGAWDGA